MNVIFLTMRFVLTPLTRKKEKFKSSIPTLHNNMREEMSNWLRQDSASTWCKSSISTSSLDDNTAASPQPTLSAKQASTKGSTGTVTLHEDPPTLARFGVGTGDELMLHFEVCKFSFSEVVTWIKRRVDYILKAWMVNEIDSGPDLSNPKFLTS